MFIVSLLPAITASPVVQPALGAGQPTPDLPAAARNGDVPMYRGNAARTGVMPGHGPAG
jgi:hypothetical protein